MRDEQVVATDEHDLDDEQRQSDDEGQDEGQLDARLALVAP